MGSIYGVHFELGVQTAKMVADAELETDCFFVESF